MRSRIRRLPDDEPALQRPREIRGGGERHQRRLGAVVMHPDDPGTRPRRCRRLEGQEHVPGPGRVGGLQRGPVPASDLACGDSGAQHEESRYRTSRAPLGRPPRGVRRVHRPSRRSIVSAVRAAEAPSRPRRRRSPSRTCRRVRGRSNPGPDGGSEPRGRPCQRGSRARSRVSVIGAWHRSWRRGLIRESSAG